MAKPFNDEGGSGFHLHVSLVDADGHERLRRPGDGEHGLSTLGMQAIAGVLAHAKALTALMNPTINSYKRFGPDTLAPWLVDWGLDNRSAMVRIPPERGGGSRMEVRLGDATANPYLAIAGTLAAAYLGIRDGLTPPARWRATATTRSPPRCCRSGCPTRSTRSRRDTALKEVLGEEFCTSFVTVQAQRGRALRAARHRLGVHRVRVPPVTRAAPDPRRHRSDADPLHREEI